MIPAKFRHLMIPDTHFEQCKLILADTGEDTISFKIRRSKYIINPENLNRMEKIGCKFTRITPAFETTIQRYMQQIERESRQKIEPGIGKHCFKTVSTRYSSLIWMPAHPAPTVRACLPALSPQPALNYKLFAGFGSDDACLPRFFF